MANIAAYIKTHAPLLDVMGPHVKIKRAGASMVTNCPFHRDRSPSMSINPAKSYWHCFSCGKHGDQIGFIMELHQCSFIDACKLLIESFNIPPPENLRRKLIRQEIREAEAVKDLPRAKELAKQL